MEPNITLHHRLTLTTFRMWFKIWNCYINALKILLVSNHFLKESTSLVGWLAFPANRTRLFSCFLRGRDLLTASQVCLWSVLYYARSCWHWSHWKHQNMFSMINLMSHQEKMIVITWLHGYLSQHGILCAAKGSIGLKLRKRSPWTATTTIAESLSRQGAVYVWHSTARQCRPEASPTKETVRTTQSFLCTFPRPPPCPGFGSRGGWEAPESHLLVKMPPTDTEGKSLDSEFRIQLNQ